MNDYIGKIEEVLNSYRAVNLSDIEELRLLKRIDTKFIFNLKDLPDILKKAKRYYKVLEIDDRRLFRYKTDYFDTTDQEMFLAHHDGRLKRFKIRNRHYIDSDTSFLEVKKKTNKGLIIKERLKSGIENQEPSDTAIKFIETHTPYLVEDLRHQFFSKYHRFTLINNRLKEKITIDLNLGFQSDHKSEHFPFLVVAEVKQTKLNFRSLFIKLLKEKRIQSISFSKYCMGTILLNSDNKYNRFKNNLRTINKLKNDTKSYT